MRLAYMCQFNILPGLFLELTRMHACNILTFERSGLLADTERLRNKKYNKLLPNAVKNFNLKKMT